MRDEQGRHITGTIPEDESEALEASRGLGDTLAKAFHAIGVDRLVGKDCGCEQRQEVLNRLFPYGKP